MAREIAALPLAMTHKLRTTSYSFLEEHNKCHYERAKPRSNLAAQEIAAQYCEEHARRTRAIGMQPCIQGVIALYENNRTRGHYPGYSDPGGTLCAMIISRKSFRRP